MPLPEQFSQHPSDVVSEEEYDAVEYARHRRRHSRKWHGRLWVLAIFFVYSAKGIFAYLCYPAPRMLSAVITSELWTVVLSIAMWNRRSWARYVFCVYVLLASLVCMIRVSEILKLAPTANTTPLVIMSIVDVAVAVALICVPSIRRLASRNYA